MIYLLVSSFSPRLSYTLDLVFSRLLGTQYEAIHVDAYPSVKGDSTWVINYTGLPIAGTFHVHCAPLLYTDKLSAPDLHLVIKDIPYLFCCPEDMIPGELAFDIFSAVFYLVSEFEKYGEMHLDAHGRYDVSAYPSAQCQLDQLPLVHLYCELLWERLEEFFGKRLPRIRREYDYRITWDIDFPWKYLHKGPGILLAGLVKDVLNGEWKRAGERLTTWLTRKDPHDTFDLIFKHSPPEQSAFFFLIDRNSPHDSRFTYRNRHLRSLISLIRKKGFRTGIHPSYTAFLDPERIKHEISALKEMLSTDITDSRQHFLKYRLPDTYRHLIAAGVTDDYTPCLLATGGFPNGMAVAYPWFDVLANTTTSLMLHPAQIMDRTLQQYLELSPEDARKRTVELQTLTRQVGGTFTVVFHNDALSESEEWTGWRQAILNMIKQVS